MAATISSTREPGSAQVISSAPIRVRARLNAQPTLAAGRFCPLAMACQAPPRTHSFTFAVCAVPI